MDTIEYYVHSTSSHCKKLKRKVPIMWVNISENCFEISILKMIILT